MIKDDRYIKFINLEVYDQEMVHIEDGWLLHKYAKYDILYNIKCINIQI